jgi:hypothetical protein
MAALPDGRIALADPARHVVRLLGRVPTDGGPGPYTLGALAGGMNQAGYVNAGGGAARFDTPSGIAVLPDGSLVVADQGNHRIRHVELDGTVTLFAGSGDPDFLDGAASDARFDTPLDVAADDAGNVYVADGENHVIRRIAAGVVTTVAGSGVSGYQDSNDHLEALFYGLEGIEAAPDGATLWLADGARGENLPYNRVRRIRFP